MAKSTSTLTAYLLHKVTTRFRVISNGGGQIRQAGQATSQPGRQLGHQPGSQASRQARRRADALQGDLGQFLRPGKNPYAWQHIWGKTDAFEASTAETTAKHQGPESATARTQPLGEAKMLAKLQHSKPRPQKPSQNSQSDDIDMHRDR